MEVGDRDICVEDADGFVVPGLFSFCEDPVCGTGGEEGPGPTFSPALFYVGEGPERFERAFAGIGAVWVVPKAKKLKTLSEKS